MKRLLLLILTFGRFAGAAYAHNGMIHVMGTVTAITANSISVRRWTEKRKPSPSPATRSTSRATQP